jgi:hypothetical protein
VLGRATVPVLGVYGFILQSIIEYSHTCLTKCNIVGSRPVSEDGASRSLSGTSELLSCLAQKVWS